MFIEQLPGCCSAQVVSNFHRQATLEQLTQVEEFARKDDQSTVMATISENQRLYYHSDELLAKAGWRHIHTFRSKPYGGGRVYVYAKNLKPLPGEAPQFDEDEQANYRAQLEREAALAAAKEAKTL